MYKKLFFIIFLIGFNSFSQEIYIDTESNYSFNKNNEELLIFKKDSVSIYDLNSFHLLEKKEIISPPNFDFSVYHILDKEPIHFVEINGGKVYQLNNDTIQRIDNSYTHKMTWDSNLFTYNDTIYRYGGYGFWTTNNKLTFYDTVTNEWQIISSVNGIYPKGSCSSFYKILNDKLYIIGGEKVNPEDLNQRINNDEIWSFDFKAKKWENIGLLNQNIKYSNNSFELNGNIFSPTYEFILEVDLKNSLLKEYALDPIIQKTIYGVNKPFVHKDNIYLWIQYDSGLKLVKTKLDTLNFNLINEQALVKNNYIVVLKLLIVIACIIFLIFLFSIKKKYKENSNKLLFKNNKVFIKDNFTNINADENKLLTLLINNDFSITNENLVNNFYNADLDRSQNIRNINKFISDLNLKLKTMLNSNNDILYKTVNPLDKRMKIVMLNRDFIRN
jgi:hypothetical protein|tara:strand:- start:778 stop:2109 length:1332 start_codon:yes stop_codon:yes gene_type:complete